MPAIDVKQQPSPFVPIGSWLAAAIEPRLPAGATPNQVTAVSFVAHLAGAAGFYLAGRDPRWFLLAVTGLLVHWVLDFVDGEVARRRKLTSDRGFFVDQFADDVGLISVMLAIGLSGYASPLLWVGYAILALLRVVMLLHEILLTRAYVIPFPSEEDAPFVLTLVVALVVLTGAGPSILGVTVGWFDLFGGAFFAFSAVELVTSFVRLFRALPPADT